jgi:hypothetical protein
VLVTYQRTERSRFYSNSYTPLAFPTSRACFYEILGYKHDDVMLLLVEWQVVTGVSEKYAV